MDLSFFATSPRGVERALAAELRALGAARVREARGGVAFSGALAAGYRACLWSRLATRVLLGLGRVPAASAEQDAGRQSRPEARAAGGRGAGAPSVDLARLAG